MRNIFNLFIVLTLLFTSAGCKKLVQVTAPPNYTGAEDVFNNDVNATALMTNVYANMSMSEFANLATINAFIECYGGLAADELRMWDPTTGRDGWTDFYPNRLREDVGAVNTIWQNVYKFIYSANVVLAGVTSSTALSAPVKKQLEGEARFMRAYHYFYLAALWGDVPIVLGTDYQVTSRILRSPVDSVYRLVIEDLTKAKELLSSDFVAYDLVTTTDERVRPTKYAAMALLARVQLQRGAFAQAEEAASAVIDQHDLFDTVPLTQVFLKNNRETIWALQNVRKNANTSIASFLVIPDSGPDQWSHPFYLNPRLIDSFETGDQRRISWIGKATDNAATPAVDYYYAYKYKSVETFASITEYEVLFRLAEQYLIRAEARAQQGKDGDAADDLNVIRRRAGLPNTNAAASNELVQAVRHERQTELFLEGHRWLDLKRTGSLDAVMSAETPLKGGTWQSHQALFPIPLAERQKIKGLTQNEGY